MEIPKRKLHLSTMDFQGRTVTLQGISLARGKIILKSALGCYYLSSQESCFRGSTGSSLTERHHFRGKSTCQGLILGMSSWGSNWGACGPCFWRLTCQTAEVNKRRTQLWAVATYVLKKNGDWVERRRDSLVINNGYMMLYDMYMCVCVFTSSARCDWPLMRTYFIVSSKRGASRVNNTWLHIDERNPAPADRDWISRRASHQKLQNSRDHHLFLLPA